MRARVATVPPFPAHPDARVGVLFSGGLDCTVLAVVLDRVLPAHEAIDLITVAFENPRKLKAQNGVGGKGKSEAPPVEAQDEVPSADPPVNSPIYDVPDRITARNSWEELKRLRPERRWNLVEVNVPYREMLEHRQLVVDLMKPQRTVMDLVRRSFSPRSSRSTSLGFSLTVCTRRASRSRSGSPLEGEVTSRNSTRPGVPPSASTTSTLLRRTTLERAFS